MESGEAYVWCHVCYNVMGDMISEQGEVSDTTDTGTFKWWKGKTFAAPQAIPPKPRHPKYAAYQATPNEQDFYPKISNTVFWQMAGWLLRIQDTEIGGTFIYDAELDEITWAHLDNNAVMTGGHVNSGRGEATAAALAAGHGIPNGQFHTHPGFGSWFSGEDNDDQAEFVHDAAKINPDGYQVFIVFDQLSWRTTIAYWKDGKPHSRRSGYVQCQGNVLNFRSFRVATYKRGLRPTKEAQLLLPSEAETSEFGFVRNGKQEELPGLDKVQVEDANKWLYVGTWSDDDMDYEPLFNKFAIPVGDWKQLYDEINATYGFDNYRTIIERSDSWEIL
jgi:hypothetical protein